MLCTLYFLHTRIKIQQSWKPSLYKLTDLYQWTDFKINLRMKVIEIEATDKTITKVHNIRFHMAIYNQPIQKIIE